MSWNFVSAEKWEPFVVHWVPPTTNNLIHENVLVILIVFKHFKHLCQLEVFPFQWRIRDFPDGWAPTPKEGCQPIIWLNFAENCMKMKKIGPRGRPQFYYVDPPLPSEKKSIRYSWVLVVTELLSGAQYNFVNMSTGAQV